MRSAWWLAVRHRRQRQSSRRRSLDVAAEAATADPQVQALVNRLDLERYKATIKGLTPFGDRRQGTERNRKAVD